MNGIIILGIVAFIIAVLFVAFRNFKFPDLGDLLGVNKLQKGFDDFSKSIFGELETVQQQVQKSVDEFSKNNPTSGKYTVDQKGNVHPTTLDPTSPKGLTTDPNNNILRFQPPSIAASLKSLLGTRYELYKGYTPEQFNEKVPESLQKLIKNTVAGTYIPLKQRKISKVQIQ